MKILFIMFISHNLHLRCSPVFHKKKHLRRDAFWKNWQWPTFPARFQASIFGAKGLYFCVRNENRCYSLAKITSNGWMFQVHSQLHIQYSVNKFRIWLWLYDIISSLIWSSPLPISITQLHTLLHFHLWPINLVFFKGYY